MDNAAISLQGLSRRFDDLIAVDKIDLEIPRGELFGLLGPNGAGKTTIIKMLTTMLKPTSGKALVWGHDVMTQRDAVRSSVGVVFQDPSVDSMLTSRENLDFHGRMYGMSGTLRKQRIDEVLRLVDLEDKADIKLEDYSGGMQRRLEIARGLMHHPHVLFLDEPTLGLDAQTRRYIWRYIKDMNRQEGVTVVLTTHYMDEADFLCNRVAIIDNGKIVALDTPKNLKGIIGADLITLEVQNDKERLIDLMKTFNWIKSVHQANGTIELMVDHAESRIPEIILKASSNNVVIRSVGLHEPTLEDVFLKFTGKKIREAESANQGRMMARMWHRRK